MLLSYETSSILYDEIDLIHGKFVPATHNSFSKCLNLNCTTYKPSPQPVRLFINIYGVFADLTGRFSFKCDNLQIPCKEECILDPEYIGRNVSKEIVTNIIEEDFFWKYVESYKWYMLLMGEIYNISHGNYYFLMLPYNTVQMDDKLLWVYRHFGNEGAKRSFICDSNAWVNLIHSRNDILISSDLLRIEEWVAAGGSGFWWSEIDGKCNDLRELSK